MKMCGNGLNVYLLNYSIRGGGGGGETFRKRNGPK